MNVTPEKATPRAFLYSAGEQPTLPWFKPAITVGVCGGYASALLTARHLTLIGVVLLTTITLTWFSLYFLLFSVQRTLRRWSAYALAICAGLTILSALLGMGCDWLLLVMTTGVIVLSSPLLCSLIVASVLWLTAALMLFITNGSPNPTQFNLLVAFLFMLIFTFTLRHLLDARTQMQRLLISLSRSKTELEAAHLQLQRYSAQIEELSITHERNRIAREIHDTLGHHLTLLVVQLETATRMEEHADVGLAHQLIEARHVARECLVEVRRSVSTLRPAEITTGTFKAALQQLISEYEHIRNIQVTLDVEEAVYELTPLLRATLYRCVQEALTNIHKHAQATKALLRLRTEQHQVELTVLDNGRGMVPQEQTPQVSFGLLGMRERVEALGGKMRAAPEPQRGWRVEIVLPREDKGTQPPSRLAHAALSRKF